MATQNDTTTYQTLVSNDRGEGILWLETADGVTTIHDCGTGIPLTTDELTNLPLEICQWLTATGGVDEGRFHIHIPMTGELHEFIVESSGLSDEECERWCETEPPAYMDSEGWTADPERIERITILAPTRDYAHMLLQNELFPNQSYDEAN